MEIYENFNDIIYTDWDCYFHGKLVNIKYNDHLQKYVYIFIDKFHDKIKSFIVKNQHKIYIYANNQSMGAVGMCYVVKIRPNNYFDIIYCTS